MSKPRLFTTLKLRGIETKNRIIISPMCQYSADDGLANLRNTVCAGNQV